MQVYGLCILENGCPGIVTEYVPSTLLEWMEGKAQGPADGAAKPGMDYSLLCAIGKQIIEALAFLHGQRVCAQLSVARFIRSS